MPHPSAHASPLATGLWLCGALLAAPAGAQTGVSDDRVSLPEGPGSLEGVGENVEVDPNMGLMRYSVPIHVPGGYHGMTPALALSYSSGGGGSVVGMGWSLAMPSVERTTARGLPEYDRDDEFAVNGDDQLVRVPGTDPPQYRARFEKGFVRYTWLDAGDGTEGYWRAELADGRTSYYGASQDGTLKADARVSGITGTFRYHLVETVDRYGHRVEYSYSLFDGNVTLLQHIGWTFDGATPRYEVTFQYEPRSDLLSDCRPGFNELLTKRLRRVNVFAGGTKLRYYDLAYEDEEVSGGFSRLASVQQYGLDDTPYPSHETFSYSRGLGARCDGVDCQRPYVKPMGSIGVSLGTGKATLIDLNGDALPDIVDASEAGQPHRIFLNHLAANGDHTFSAPLRSAVGTQSSHGLGSPYVQVLDADGDGRTDMLNVQTGKVLKNLGGGDWDATVVSLWDQASSPFSEAEMATMHFIDYDNDKRIDLIRSQGADTANVTAVYRNVGAAGFSQDEAAENIGAGFDSNQLELNDMNGDGLLDAVQVTLDAVRYRLNLGWGRWDDWTTIGGFDFTDQESIDAELEDLNGDALADLVLVSGNTVRYWLNRNGDSFDPEEDVTSAEVDGDLPVRDGTVVVLYADMNGNGSSDVVWIDAQGAVNYLELFPVRPNLMSRVENGLGKVTELGYGSSAEQQARDREAGQDWPYPLPHPMMLVERYDEWDSLTQVHQVTEYTYHDGFYDGAEKQFRGYARVEQVEPGDASSEPGLALDVYDVGADDPYRNGLLLQREIRGEGGRSLQLQQTTYDDCEVAGLPASGLSYDVRHICKVGERTEQREGLAASAWVTTESRWRYNGYGQTVWEAELGVTAIGGDGCPACAAEGYTGTPCGAQCLGDERYASTDYAEPASNADRWILNRPVRERSYGEADGEGEPATDVYSEKLTYYDGTPFVGLALGEVTHGSVTRVTERVDADGALVETIRNRLDAHGNVIEQLDPNGSADGVVHRRRYTTDALGLKVVRTELLLEDGDGPYQLARDYAYHPIFDAPQTASQWMLVRDGATADAPRPTTFGYDAFGRLTSTTHPGEAEGQVSESYTWELGSPSSRVTIRARSVKGGAFDMENVRCFDGHGREYQERILMEPGRYKVTGFKVFNTKGEEQIVYQPYSADSAECDTAPPAGTLAVTTRFDALDRAVERVLPDADPDDGEAEVTRTEYLPLAEVYFDQEDTAAQGPHAATPEVRRHNGLGNLIAHELLLSAGSQPLTYRYQYDALGHLSRLTDPAGTVKRQRHDLLGRVVAIDDPDRGSYAYAYDAAGNRVRTEDPRGQVMRNSYDGANRPLATWDERDEAASKVQFRYDTPGACPADKCGHLPGHLAGISYPLDGGARGQDWMGFDARGNARYFGRQLQGHLFDFYTEHDNVGRVIGNAYPGGLAVEYRLNGEGKVTAVPGYVEAVRYDERWMVADVELSNGVTVSRAYDARFRPSAMTAVGPGAQAILAYGYRHDRVGNLLEVTDDRADDGTPMGGARFTFDALYRLTSAHLDPTRSEHAELISVSYDEVGNITAKRSDRGASSAAHVGAYTYGGGGAGPHAVTLAGDTAFSYDAAGNMLSRGDARYTWDYQGRLIQANDGALDAASFAYGSADQRLIKREGSRTGFFVSEDFEVRDGTATVYIRIGHDRVVKVEQPDFAASFLTDLAPASGPDSAVVPAPDGAITSGDAWIAQAAAEGILELAGGAPRSDVAQLLEAALSGLLDGHGDKVTFLHQDHLGGTVAVTDARGVLVERSEYYPFGLTRYASGVGEDYGYTGKELDRSTGLIYFGARYLDPWTGRWSGADPAFAAVEEDDLDPPDEACNAYAYSRNNPVSYIDSDGDIAIGVAIGVFAAVGAISGAITGVVTNLAVRAIKGEKVGLNWGTAWAVTKGVVVGGLLGGIVGAVAPALGAAFAVLAGGATAVSGMALAVGIGATILGDVVSSAGEIGAAAITKMKGQGEWKGALNQGAMQGLGGLGTGVLVAGVKGLTGLSKGVGGLLANLGIAAGKGIWKAVAPTLKQAGMAAGKAAWKGVQAGYNAIASKVQNYKAKKAREKAMKAQGKAWGNIAKQAAAKARAKATN